MNKSKIEAKDFFSITEMIGKNVIVKMNEYTYKYILGIVFTGSNDQSIINIKDRINDLKIEFVSSMNNNDVIIEPQYKPVSRKQVEIEIF